MSVMMFAACVVILTALYMLGWFIMYGVLYLSATILHDRFPATDPLTKNRLLKVFVYCLFGGVVSAIAGAIA